ncbi:MAG: glycosyltransferase [Rhizobiales bacterium]|nr:glycosyltransferase [Hyphomicrobiales bacterium]
MISVVIPTLNAARTLPHTLASLVPGMVEGIVKEVVVVDGGSSDATLAIVEEAGARLVASARGRGTQLAVGAEAARGDWLLFIHADTVLEEGWVREVRGLVESERVRCASGSANARAAAFRFALDDHGAGPRVLEQLVGWRCALLGLPYGDQGLLVHRQRYENAGGFRDIPLMEDVDLVGRLGRGSIVMLRTRAVTSAERFRRSGYVKRSARNLFCLTLFYLRVPPRMLARLYGS